MNIFVLDDEPSSAAKMHCDKHTTKMILESVQMLSTVCRLTGLDVGYKKTHQNHPCTVWARQSIDNYLWLKELTINLNEEWKFRYNHTRNHKSFDVMMDLPTPSLPNIGLTPFAQAMPEQYKNNNAITAYRDYYINDKIKILQYTKREAPLWLQERI